MKRTQASPQNKSVIFKIVINYIREFRGPDSLKNLAMGIWVGVRVHGIDTRFPCQHIPGIYIVLEWWSIYTFLKAGVVQNNSV